MVEISKQRSDAIANALSEVSDVLVERNDLEFIREALKFADPELRPIRVDYLPRWMIDLLSILANLYDEGYQDGIKDLQKGR